MSQRATSQDELMDESNQAHDDQCIPRPSSSSNASQSRAAAEAASKLKRTACVLCRKRKLRCDGTRPACGTCSRLGHDCKYDEAGRKKSGPKRGYVKALEQRLAQVETMLHGQDDIAPNMSPGVFNPHNVSDLSTLGLADPTDLSHMAEMAEMNSLEPSDPAAKPPIGNTIPDLEETFSFGMISLGLEEPLPSTVITDELNRIYFECVHTNLPMIHRARFAAAMDLAPQLRPPVCLRYAMWAYAAGASDKYEYYQTHFYARARKYLEMDEMRGFGQSILTIAHCQAWILVAMYEFKNMFFPRAWMSTGRAVRLTQMLCLHRLDGTGLDVKRTLPPPRDWTEREERRRTFWFTYWADRCASIGTGWPMSFEEKDILTNLPASDENFQNCQPVQTVSLEEALHNVNSDFSSMAGCILMATLFGRNLTHLHRPDVDDNEEDLNGKFWQRHRSIDSILLNIKLTLPPHLRLPLGLKDPAVIFLNMCLHASVICLHQAAIFKAEKHQLPTSIASESKMRCVVAAGEIAGIMKTISHMDIVSMNPFLSFCLYVAARVFVQFLKARPNEQQVLSSLQFVLAVMHIMVKKNALTESFIAQLEVDMESSGVPNPTRKNSTGIAAAKAQGLARGFAYNHEPLTSSGCVADTGNLDAFADTRLPDGSEGLSSEGLSSDRLASKGVHPALYSITNPPDSTSESPILRHLPHRHMHPSVLPPKDLGIFSYEATQQYPQAMDLTPPQEPDLFPSTTYAFQSVPSGNFFDPNSMANEDFNNLAAEYYPMEAGFAAHGWDAGEGWVGEWDEMMGRS